MYDRHLTRSELHRLLIQCGQIPADEPGTDVWPSPDSILTIALGLDRCQDEHNRERYFVTMLDDEHRPALCHHPDFVLPGPFAQAIVVEPIGGKEYGGNFLLGPVRWLCRRLAQLPCVLAWPQDRIREESGFVNAFKVDEMPELRAWLGLHIPDATDIGAILLDPNDARDARVLWEIACQTEYGFDNYFLSDCDATEVYMLHHHSKILASVKDETLRDPLARELASVPDVIEDCSASVLDWGDDDWDDGDNDEDYGS